MNRPMNSLSSRAGFTLAEMLVAMALLAVLAAVVVPNVLNQLNKGEVNRVVSDLNSLSQAAKTFYSDVQRYPADLTQLSTSLSGTAEDFGTTGTDGADYTAEFEARWKGPYLDRGQIDGTGIKTGFGATVLTQFTADTWNGSNWIALEVSPIQQEEFTKINQIIDGDSPAAGNDATGKLTYDATAKKAKFRMIARI